MKTLAIVLAGAAFISGCSVFMPVRPIAVAELKPTQGSNVSGTVTFVQRNGEVLVDARIKGLTPGPHGFHIHEVGDCSAPDASSAGGHYNPTRMAHGAPDAAVHHGGDFGNLVADANGESSLSIGLPLTIGNMAKAGDSASIIGRAVVVHADADDLVSQPAGNSGKRLACGVIALQ
ncbi:MAG: superoxide dismutase family protein [Janthinobacterium lividum]